MESSLQRSSASFAWAANCSRSMPTSAAGRRPKIDSAEKRPPTVGSPLKTASQPSSCAWRSSCEPGSVMATRWFAKLISGACASKASRSAEESRRGSMVPPDFEDTITSVVAGSQSASSSRMRTGESESSVLNETRFARTVSDLLYFVMVMGACVDPPWPMRTTVLMPLATTSSAKR